MTSVRRSEVEPAFLMHQRPFRDTSALLELLTAEHGRIGAVARGVRGRRARQAGLLQPFQPLHISWQARGELATLTSVESAGRPITLERTWLVSGFYANELLLRLLAREDPHPDVFESYMTLLLSLAQKEPQGPSLRVFERDLLAATGYGLALTRDTSGDHVAPDRWYRYDPEHGAVAVSAPATGTTARVVPGYALLDLADGRPGEADDRWLKPLTRAVLRLYIGKRPLKSRELYARYRRSGINRKNE